MCIYLNINIKIEYYHSEFQLVYFQEFSCFESCKVTNNSTINLKINII